MKTNDYVKFVTEQVVTYMDIPSEEKKSKKEQKKQEKELFANRWFGILPVSMKLLTNRYRNKAKDGA